MVLGLVFALGGSLAMEEYGLRGGMGRKGGWNAALQLGMAAPHDLF